MVVTLPWFLYNTFLPELMTQKLQFTMDADDDDELQNNHEAVNEDE